MTAKARATSVKGRPGAGKRLQRLIAVVPWIAANDGPRLEDVAARFAYDPDELVEDLQLLFLCGLYPYTPDMLVDVHIADERVWVRYADFFSRPLRLTPGEALSLLAAGKAFLSTPGTESDGPLARGLGKLAAALDLPAGDVVDVSLGPAPGAALDVLSEAASTNHQVEMEYYSFGRDELTRRVIDPYAVFSAGGQWYAAAFCHTVGDERLFRLDRVREARMLDSPFEPPATPPDLAIYKPQPDDPRVTLELAPSAEWVAEQYPVEDRTQTKRGRIRVTLVASERAWLERILLRLGPDAKVVRGDKSILPSAARRVLERYRPKV
jgi:proteasome accessory factor C